MILGIIPARGGSKGVINKNIRLINGTPLINYTIQAAIDSKELDDFFVSTDSEEIKSVAEIAGASVPFLRPKNLSTDTASTLSVVSHALEWYEQSRCDIVELIVLLQPTTPMRTAADIDKSICMMKADLSANSLISCYDATHVHPSIMYKDRNGRLAPLMGKEERDKRRQDFSPVYVRNGAIYIVKREYFIQNNSLISESPLCYKMPRIRSINIDEELDLVIAESLINYRDR